MARVTITKLTLVYGDYWIANVSDGIDTIVADNRIGLWTTPVDAAGNYDPNADHGSNQVRRRELYPEVAARLRSRVRAAERGEAQDESDVVTDSRTPTTQTLARRMAKAGVAAIREAA